MNVRKRMYWTREIAHNHFDRLSAHPSSTFSQQTSKKHTSENKKWFVFSFTFFYYLFNCFLFRPFDRLCFVFISIINMTIVATEDKRNQEWRNSNVGLKLLEKMGYKDGEGIGKRNTNNTALRALKRKEGLGLGAKIESEGGNSESSNHFSAVLANLQAHHQPAATTKKSKKKTKKLTLPQNKVTAGHAAKRREAKFGAKSAEDMACIFGNSSVVLDLKPIGETTKEEEKRKKKKRSRDSDDEKRDEDKLEKKKRKKNKKRRKEEKKEKSED